MEMDGGELQGPFNSEDFLFLSLVVKGDHGGSTFLKGIKSQQPGYMHKHRGLNWFEEAQTRIPNDARPRQSPKASCDWIARFFYNPAIRRLVADAAAMPARASGKAYRIEDNGGMPFVCYVRDDAVSVFRVPTDGHIDVRDCQEEWQRQLEHQRLFYTEEVCTFYNPITTLIGVDESDCNAHGNSILVHVSGQTYAYIGLEIYSFDSPDPVALYYSIMGNSSVPYPVAVTQRSVIFMLDRVVVPRNQIEPLLPKKDNGQDDWSNAYQAFYSFRGQSEPVPNMKALCPRIF